MRAAASSRRSTTRPRSSLTATRRPPGPSMLRAIPIRPAASTASEGVVPEVSLRFHGTRRQLAPTSASGLPARSVIRAPSVRCSGPTSAASSAAVTLISVSEVATTLLPTGSPSGPVRLAPWIDSGASASENTIRIGWCNQTPAAPSAGVIETTVGGTTSGSIPAPHATSNPAQRGRADEAWRCSSARGVPLRSCEPAVTRDVDPTADRPGEPSVDGPVRRCTARSKGQSAWRRRGADGAAGSGRDAGGSQGDTRDSARRHRQYSASWLAGKTRSRDVSGGTCSVVSSPRASV